MGSGTPASLVPESQEGRTLRALRESARTWEPGNPDFDLQLGAHLERIALGSIPRSRAQLGLLEASASLYRRAIERRPTWPLGLTSLLRVDLKRGRLGTEFGALYRRAAGLGGQEPAAQRALVDLGLVAWPLVDPETRTLVRALLVDALRRQSRYVLERSIAVGRIEVLEPLLADSAELRAEFDRLRAKSPVYP